MTTRARGRSRGRALLVATLATVAMVATRGAQVAHAQLPKQPKNLQVLPRDLSTDSVFTIMLGVANALGVTCGSCHPGGDNRTWDSTNFSGDVKPMKATARAMFRLVNQLNGELLPAIVNRGASAVRVTCETCHRGATRPVTIEDSISTVIERQGVDSAIAEYQRIRERYAGRMTFDLTPFPLRTVALRLANTNRFAEAIKLLEFDVHLFPDNKDIAGTLARVYRAAGRTPLLR